MVGLQEDTARLYPHELSGGMKQRVCIAVSIALQPKVIIADEPTSALDVVVQRQMMQTLGRVQQRIGAAVILVGHDMGLLAQFVDRLWPRLEIRFGLVLFVHAFIVGADANDPVAFEQKLRAREAGENRDSRLFHLLPSHFTKRLIEMT